MNGNLNNGGLIMQAGESLFITDIKNYTGTYSVPITRPDAEPIHFNSLFWFMNEAGNFLYYSDQLKGNALCRLDIEQQKEELLLDKPCYQLLRHEDWIYYIHEEDHRLYCYTTNGKRNTKLIDEHVDSFLMHEGLLYYATPRGIFSCTETGGAQEGINGTVTTGLIKVGDKLVYADNRNGYGLTLFDLKGNETTVIDNIDATGINTDGRYIYCANRLNNRSLYRIDPVLGNSIRICGESADYLHVLGNDIYLSSDRVWHRLSLLGGEAETITLTGRYSHEL